MKPHQFNQLDEMEQVEAVWSADKVSQQTSEPGFLIELYRYKGLFLEVKVNLETRGYVYIKPMLTGWN
ncbi:MAG: hypothetical protein EOO04_06535 [Chitinophagaceae bacterium]|nr:MAG: hypothetical protein EOO04_06535 [Chitinophagaceae bacterium]